MLRLALVPPLVANFLSIAVAALLTFALHARFTFRVKVSGSAAGSYAVVVFLGLAVATAVFSLSVALDVSLLFAKLAATASAIALQFALNRAVVFHSSKTTHR